MVQLDVADAQYLFPPSPAVQQVINNLSRELDILKTDVDPAFAVTLASFVFCKLHLSLALSNFAVMNAGFAFLEAGAERAKNMGNLLTKV